MTQKLGAPETDPSKERVAISGSVRIVLSHTARANLELRSISVMDVEHALRSGITSRVDDKTGHLVCTVDDQGGGIRVVAEKAGDTIKVLTAMRPEEVLEHAEWRAG